MIRTTNHSGLFCFFPVALKIRVNIINAFRGFNKSKSKLHFIHLHITYIIPRNVLLVAGYVNAVNNVLRRNRNAKLRITNKFQLLALPPQIAEIKDKTKSRHQRNNNKKSLELLFGFSLSCHAAMIVN